MTNGVTRGFDSSAHVRGHWRHIAVFLRPYARQQLCIVLTICVISIVSLVTPFLTRWLIDVALPERDLPKVMIYVALMIATSIFTSFVSLYQGYLNATVAEFVIRDIREALYAHLHRLPISFFTNTKSGEVMTRVNSDIEKLDAAIRGTLIAVVANAAAFLATIYCMFLFNVTLAIVAIAVIPLMVTATPLAARRLFQLSKESREKRDCVENVLQETLAMSGVLLMKLFVRETFERDRFHRVVTDLMSLEIRSAIMSQRYSSLIAFMFSLGPVLIWLVGAILITRNTVSIGTVVVFVTLLGRLYAPASALTELPLQVAGATAVVGRLAAYFELVPEVRSPEATPLGSDLIQGNLCFKNVTFAYDPERFILDGLSFAVRAGEVAAFVGPSGGGKTTIAQLIARLHEPESGSITIDERDIRDYDLDVLRNSLGFVMQETYLFHDTIAANLRYGRLDASDQQLEEAACAANLHDVICALPLGYGTIVGDRGHKLSGGERQRLAIARVFLKDPRILILDEATSQLDAINEALIQDALGRLMAGRTTLIIAHRLSTITAATSIFVVDDAKIVESGSHAELLTRNDRYAALYRAAK